jgi:Xaa-Pro dipeptidase
MAHSELWFEPAEYASRLARVQQELQALGRDALLVFQPESVTWLTGFYTRGYTSFQCALVPASGEPVVFCRDVEAYHLDRTCAYAGRVFWRDGETPTRVAARAVQRLLGPSPDLAIELSAWPLSAARFAVLRDALPTAGWHDVGELIGRLRLIKSSAEVAYQRRAGRAAEAGMEAAVATAGIGVSEREMAAEVCAAMIRAGSDVAGPGVMASGERALHLHGSYSDRILERSDIVQIETTPCVRHYHARFMRPIRVAEASDADHAVVEKLVAIQDAALGEVRPGVPAAVPDRFYREGVLAAGLRETYTNKTFYSVGLMLPPTTSEPLDATPASDWTFESGMTLHTYVLARGFGMSETIHVTGDGYERLTNFTRRLLVSA